MSKEYVTAVGYDSNTPVVIEDDEEVSTHAHTSRKGEAARKLLQAQVDKLLEENKNLSKGNLDLQMFKNELEQKVERLEFQLEGRDNELQEAGQKELEASIRAKQTTEVVDALREHHRIERREVRIKIGQIQTDCENVGRC